MKTKEMKKFPFLIKEVEQTATTFFDLMRLYELKSGKQKKSVHLVIDNHIKLKRLADQKSSTIFAVVNAIIDEWFRNEG